MATKHYIKKEYPNFSSLPLTGEDNIFYETINDGNIYRWDNFNTSYSQVGSISGLTGGTVISALGYTPYNSTNPSGYISGITGGDVTSALGYIPYNSTNPSGYITGITGSDVTTALGYTPYDAVNPSGYIDVTALAPYQLAFGFTPEDVANKDIDGTLSANSDTLYASQKAVKTYIDASVTGVLDDRGNWDASGNVFPTTGGSGVAGAILKGDLWFVSAPGILGSTSVVVGNNFRALVDNPTLSTDWNILNVGLGYIPEDSANKGIANGYAGLDSGGKVPLSQLPVIQPRVLTITTSGSPSINTDLYDAVNITGLAVAITSMTSGLTGTYNNFQKLTIRIKDNGTARAITWGASYANRGGILPTTTVASKVVNIGLIYNLVAATWDCVAVSQEV